jgi:hypothetical protein
MDISRNRDQHNLPLLGKAVLLIGNDTAVLHRLIKQLVQKGADVALLCGRLPAKTAQHFRRRSRLQVTSFCWCSRWITRSRSIGQLVHHIATEWGPIDFFIDLSARQSSAALPEHGTKTASLTKVRPEKAEPLANLKPWQVTQAVLGRLNEHAAFVKPDQHLLRDWATSRSNLKGKLAKGDSNDSNKCKTNRRTNQKTGR